MSEQKQPTDLLARLDELHAKATEAPWRGELEPESERDNFHVGIYGPGSFDGLLVARCDQNGNHGDDARLILQLRNAYPALRDYIVALEKERDWWRLGDGMDFSKPDGGSAILTATDAARKAVRG